jgi:uncharacterized protein (TIGR02284 family)
MVVDTQPTLSADTLHALQDLIQANIDSHNGFRHAARALDDLTLRSTFEQLAQDRRRHADELAHCLCWNGEQPRREGSVAAAVHHTWMSIRELLSTDDRFALLCETERGEEALQIAYEQALHSTAGTPVHDVLLRHYGAVKTSLDRLRDLRDDCLGV